MDDNIGFWDDISTCLQDAGCTFDEDAAKACVSDLRSASCTEVEDGTAAEGCIDAYVCGLAESIEAAACFLF